MRTKKVGGILQRGGSAKAQGNSDKKVERSSVCRCAEFGVSVDCDGLVSQQACVSRQGVGGTAVSLTEQWSWFTGTPS